MGHPLLEPLKMGTYVRYPYLGHGSIAVYMTANTGFLHGVIMGDHLLVDVADASCCRLG
jgi:hypothetical protein